MSGIFIASTRNLDVTLDEMNRITQEWTMQAALGECSWICSDCCCTFPSGMPDACIHGHDACTKIIQRDKEEANAVNGRA
jgi:hypothetical protein